MKITLTPDGLEMDGKPIHLTKYGYDFLMGWLRSAAKSEPVIKEQIENAVQCAADINPGEYITQ